MGYTIKNFIDSNKFPGMKLISDNSGINEMKSALRSLWLNGMRRGASLLPFVRSQTLGQMCHTCMNKCYQKGKRIKTDKRMLV